MDDRPKVLEVKSMVINFVQNNSLFKYNDFTVSGIKIANGMVAKIK